MRQSSRRRRKQRPESDQPQAHWKASSLYNETLAPLVDGCQLPVAQRFEGNGTDELLLHKEMIVLHGP